MITSSSSSTPQSSGVGLRSLVGFLLLRCGSTGTLAPPTPTGPSWDMGFLPSECPDNPQVWVDWVVDSVAFDFPLASFLLEGLGLERPLNVLPEPENAGGDWNIPKLWQNLRKEGNLPAQLFPENQVQEREAHMSLRWTRRKVVHMGDWVQRALWHPIQKYHSKQFYVD